MTRVRGVVLDLDGTLVRLEMEFEAMRRDLHLPAGTPLLEAVDKMPEAERGRALQILRRHEHEAALAARLNPGVREFLSWLHERQVRQGIFSRNARDLVLL